MDTDDEEITNLAIAVCRDLEENTKETTPTPEKKRKRPHVTTAWSTEDAINLITSIESNPCLWEYSSTDYKDRQKRENAWRSVSAKCPGRDVDECKAKWANVKTAYNNTKKKLTTKSGQGASSSTPHWAFWTAMQFYHCHEKEKTTSSVSSINIASESLGSSIDLTSTPISSSSSSPAPAQKTTAENVLQQAAKLMESDTEDKWHSFGMYIASQLRELEKNNKFLAKKLHINIMKNTMDTLSELDE